MNAYEKALEYLDQKGIIDRTHVGVVGFRRTCLYVKYALTHSSQHFTALRTDMPVAICNTCLTRIRTRTLIPTACSELNLLAPDLQCG